MKKYKYKTKIEFNQLIKDQISKNDENEIEKIKEMSSELFKSRDRLQAQFVLAYYLSQSTNQAVDFYVDEHKKIKLKIDMSTQILIDENQKFNFNLAELDNSFALGIQKKYLKNIGALKWLN